MLTQFIQQMDTLMGQGLTEAQTVVAVKAALAPLLANDVWLPASHQHSVAGEYRQYPLHVDPQGRYSVVSFVWGVGASTPVHDHTVWGVIGMLRGAERCEECGLDRGDFKALHAHILKPGDMDVVSPTVGDVHRVSNAVADAPSISIHVYGGDIGRIERHVYDHRGETRPFVSGYSTPVAV
jgi:predicted metal-dependent enzyme (double-stranded beta helix superfamily)